MLRDRIILVEQEIATLKLLCGELYKQISIHGYSQYQEKYDNEIVRLTKMMSEHAVIKKMIEDGNP